MIFVSKCRVVAAVLAVAAMLAAPRARAELVRPAVPTLTWGAGLSAWMPPREDRSAASSRSGIVWTASFAAFSIGLASGRGAFPSLTPLALAPALASRAQSGALCIGPTCPGRDRAPADTGAGSDPGASAKAGSVRLVTELGPLGVAALGLFKNPVATEAHPVAMRVAPMFAFGGGGLEMRCAWW